MSDAHYPTIQELATFRRETARDLKSLFGAFSDNSGSAWPDELGFGIGYGKNWVHHSEASWDVADLHSLIRRAANRMRTEAYEKEVFLKAFPWFKRGFWP